MTSLLHAALGLQMFLRRGRVDDGRLARPRSRKGRAMILKTGKKRETGALVDRPRRCSGHKSADRAAGVSLYGRHVLARRVSRAGGQFDFRVVLLHLRILLACFERRAESPFGTRSPRPFQRPGQPRGGLQRPVVRKRG